MENSLSKMAKTEDDVITIKDEEVNVEEIMNKIRHRIKERKEKLGEDFADASKVELTKEVKPLEDHTEEDLNNYLHYTNKYCDRQSFLVSTLSKIPFLGGVMIAQFHLQTEFNSYAVRVLNKLSEFRHQTIKELDYTKNIVSQLDDETIHLKNLVLNYTGDDLGLDYFKFEEKFRGQFDEIEQQQTQFLRFFNGCKNVLDLGCGRGEFLKILKDNNIGGYGIDKDADMIHNCKKHGLNVIQADAITHLKSLKDKSLDGIFMSHVAEHLRPKELVEVLKLSHSKLNHDSNIVILTPNPMCLSIFSQGFFMDPTHVKPVHPYTLEFLLNSIGFKNIEFIYFSPIPAESQLKRLEDTNENRLMNENINKLNNLLFGYQDYAVIARK